METALNLNRKKKEGVWKGLMPQKNVSYVSMLRESAFLVERRLQNISESSLAVEKFVVRLRKKESGADG